jgi:glycosyltransferase involved in cell wall biosynthesis
MNDVQVPALPYRALLTLFRPMTDRILFSSLAVCAHARCGSEADVMYPPVDFAKFSSLPRGFEREGVFAGLELDPAIPTVVAVGNVNRVKGYEHLLDAIRILRQRGRRVQLIIVGERVDKLLCAELDRFLERHGLSRNVRFAGMTTAVQRYLAVADIFALPSVSEAVGMSLLEAMAAGLPCVATRVGGICEVVTEGNDGVLVEPYDPTGLADGLDLLLRDEALRARLGAAAQGSVACRFSVERIARRQAEVYQRLVSRNPRRMSTARRAGD